MVLQVVSVVSWLWCCMAVAVACQELAVVYQMVVRRLLGIAVVSQVVC